MAKDIFDNNTLTGISGTIDTEEQETAPDDASKNNEAFVLTFDGDDQLTNIAMTIDGTTYNRVITWTSNNPTAISAWSEA